LSYWHLAYWAKLRHLQNIIILQCSFSASLCSLSTYWVSLCWVSQIQNHMAGNTNWRGRISTRDLLINVACFKTNVNNIFNLKSSWSKPDSTRRSTVLYLPFQWGFPAYKIVSRWKVRQDPRLFQVRLGTLDTYLGCYFFFKFLMKTYDITKITSL